MMINTAYIYVVLPLIIFLSGWLKWHFAIFSVSIVCISIYYALKQYNDLLPINFSKNIYRAVIVVAIIALWVLFSGIGGYSLQTSDQHYRNAVLRDLIDQDWPVIYNIQKLEASNILQGRDSMLVYYVGYWLPSAVVGKLFGWEAANFTLFLWTVMGLTLVFYFICRMFKKFSFMLLLVFIFWGTLYELGALIKFPAIDLLLNEYNLWAGSMVYAGGNTGLIYWVFNQTITSWLILVLILNNIPKSNLIFLYTLCFFQSPFAFLGMFPYVLYIILKDCTSFVCVLKEIKPHLSFQNTAGTLTIFAITAIYFSSNTAAGHFSFLVRDIDDYMYFIFLTFGIIAILIFNKYKREPFYYLSILILLPLPFFQMGYGLDFCARVSIPSFFLLMLLVMKYLFEEPRNIMKKAVVAWLVVSSFQSIQHMARSIGITSFQYLAQADTNVGVRLAKTNNSFFKKIGIKIIAAKKENLIIKDEIKTLSNPSPSMVNFMGLTDHSFFYQYLAKKQK